MERHLFVARVFPLPIPFPMSLPFPMPMSLRSGASMLLVMRSTKSCSNRGPAAAIASIGSASASCSRSYSSVLVYPDAWHRADLSRRWFTSGSSTTPTPTRASTSSTDADDSVVLEYVRTAQELSRVQSPSPAPSAADTECIYTSPFDAVLRKMKLFSLTSCALSLLSAPVMVVLAPASIPWSGRFLMAGTVCAFGLLTTFALTRFTQPYVVRAFREKTSRDAGAVDAASAAADAAAPAPAVLVFETMNMWARPMYHRIEYESIRPIYNRLLANVRGDVHVESGGESSADRSEGVDHSVDAVSALSPPCSTARTSIDFYLHPDVADHRLLYPFIRHLQFDEEATPPKA